MCDHTAGFLFWGATETQQVRGPLVLFQAVLPLLPKETGKFVIISSGRGTIAQKHRSGEGAYGQSKVRLRVTPGL